MDADTSDRIAIGKACLEAALFYQSIGWSVLCICPPDHVGIGKEHAKSCQSHGKAPMHRWKDCQDVAATPDEIKSWWKRWPNANVGIALGPVSGLIRVDVDGPGGEARLQELSKGIVPATLEFTSGRANAGRGLLYSIPKGVKLRTTYEQPGKKEELRFQAKGAQTVLPPSKHASGTFYRWTLDRSPHNCMPCEAPEWLVAQLLENRSDSGVFKQKDWQEIFKGKPEGQRNSTMASIIGAMARQWNDLDNAGSVQVLFESIRAINERHDPPLSDTELEIEFGSIVGLEKERRVREDGKALADLVDEQIRESATVPTPVKNPVLPAPPAVNGHAESSHKWPDWKLIIIKGDPPEYLLRAPFWSGSGKLKSRNGFITLSSKQILRWGNIAIAALEQGEAIIPVRMKRWNEQLQKLTESVEHVGTNTEAQRALVILESIWSHLFGAREVTQKDDGTVNYGYGAPKKMPNGKIIFKSYWMHQKLRMEIDKLTLKELAAAFDLSKMAQAIIDNKRWWVATPQVLDDIWDKVKSGIDEVADK